jgi:RNA polymerase sigma factor (sigma-70 family)
MTNSCPSKPVDTFFCPILYCAGVLSVPPDLEVLFQMPAACSLAEVWEQKKPLLRAIVKHILLDHSLIDDVLQEAFTGILDSRRTFRSADEVYRYARIAVTNTAIDYIRRINVTVAMRTELKAGAQLVDTCTPYTQLAGVENEQLQATIQSEIQAVIETLSPERQLAVDVIFIHRRRLKDVCRETGVPYSTLRSRALAAIDEIREHLRKLGLLPERREEAPLAASREAEDE